MPQLSWPESGLFLVLLAASLYGFWLRFGKVWRTIRGSKKDPELNIRSFGRRAADFVWEVLLQGKVIWQRPLPGLAHAFVFWGFCVFALITLNHFAEGLRIGFLDRSGFFGSFYFGFAAVFAIGVAVSISGLAFRRFVVRPKWLGPLSKESGIIARLIFLLMITYLGTFVPGWESQPLALVGAHTDASGVPSAGPSHQASAFDPEPGDDFLQARPVQQDSAASRRRRFRLGYRQGRHRTDRAAGVLVRRVRPMQPALSSDQYGKASQPERNRVGRAALFERIRPGERRAPHWCESVPTYRKRPCSSAPPAARASFNVQSEFSICP